MMLSGALDLDCDERVRFDPYSDQSVRRRGGDLVDRQPPPIGGLRNEMTVECQRSGSPMPSCADDRHCPMAKKAAVVTPPTPVADIGGATRTLTLRLPPPVHDQLREMAFTSRRSQHALLLDALDLLFERHGKPPIATAAQPNPRD